MNVFKSLDTIFPCGDANRPSGEVVNTDIRVSVDNVNLGEIYMKRKAWYVNASVNAFHMHRSLVRDYSNLVRGSYLSALQIRRSKRLICLAVLNSYLANRQTDEQVYSYHLSINPRSNLSTNPSMYWNAGMRGQWVEIIDVPVYSLKELCDGAVEDFSLVGEVWKSGI